MMRYITLSFSYSFFITINKSYIATRIIDFFKDFSTNLEVSNNDSFNDFSLLIFISQKLYIINANSRIEMFYSFNNIKIRFIIYLTSSFKLFRFNIN